MIFKCKNCGGNVIYDPAREKMFCPHCEGVDCEEERYDHNRITICPNCSGELIITEHTAAVQCVYCGDYIILDERVEGEYLPQKMIRFQVNKEKVKELLCKRFYKQIFIPTDFLSDAKLKHMQGQYVPFFLYHYHTKANLNGMGVKVRVWVNGNVEYTEKSYYRVEREMDLYYKNIPVDASVPMPDTIMDMMEPYDYSVMGPFDKKYMSGFLGEKFNLGSGVLEPRALEKMEESAEQQLKNSVKGYSSVIDEVKNIDKIDGSREYALLPVWKYDYTYDGEEYPFYINGQTGKIVGKMPVSKKKVLAYSATIWGMLTVGLLLISYIVGNI